MISFKISTGRAHYNPPKLADETSDFLPGNWLTACLFHSDSKNRETSLSLPRVWGDVYVTLQSITWDTRAENKRFYL